MVAKVDIFNFALQDLGASSVSAPDENTTEARECNLRYDSVRRMILNLHLWNFATKRAQLARLSEAPVFEFGYQYQLPTDYIRMVATEKQIEFLPTGNPDFNGYLIISNRSAFQSADYFKIETNASDGTRVLLSDDETKKIVYIFDQDDTQAFSPLFIELMARGLAGAIAYRITNSRTVEEQKKAEFTNFLLATAKNIDAQEDITTRIEMSGYLSSRYSGYAA